MLSSQASNGPLQPPAHRKGDLQSHVSAQPTRIFAHISLESSDPYAQSRRSPTLLSGIGSCHHGIGDRTLTRSNGGVSRAEVSAYRRIRPTTLKTLVIGIQGLHAVAMTDINDHSSVMPRADPCFLTGLNVSHEYIHVPLRTIASSRNKENPSRSRVSAEPSTKMSLTRPRHAEPFHVPRQY